MEFFINFCIAVVAIYIVAEVASCVYVYRNRDTVVPRLRSTLRNLLGLTQDGYDQDAYNRLRSAEYHENAARISKLNRKINWIGRALKGELPTGSDCSHECKGSCDNCQN